MDDPDHRSGVPSGLAATDAGASTGDAPTCTEHPGEPALYRCDGCGRLLCAACSVPEGRLVVCWHCGELAVPLPSGLPAEEAELPPPAAPIETRAGLAELLRYPLRGRQGVLLVALGVLLVGAAGLDAAANELGCVAFVPFALLVLLVPGLLGDVTRSAAAGLGDLGEWPDYRAPGARGLEALLFFVVAAIALVPASTLLTGLGCADRLAEGRGLGPICVLLLAVALWPAALLWMSLWGVAATRGSLLETVDPRSFARRLARAPHATATAATVGWAAMVTGPALRMLLPPGSLPGMVAEALPGAYGAIVSARAAGLLLLASEGPAARLSA